MQRNELLPEYFYSKIDSLTIKNEPTTVRFNFEDINSNSLNDLANHLKHASCPKDVLIVIDGLFLTTSIDITFDIELAKKLINIAAKKPNDVSLSFQIHNCKIACNTRGVSSAMEKHAVKITITNNQHEHRLPTLFSHKHHLEQESEGNTAIPKPV